jgi:integrase
MKFFQRRGYWHCEFSVPGDRVLGTRARRYRLSTGKRTLTDAKAVAPILAQRYSLPAVASSNITVDEWVQIHLTRGAAEQWEKPRSLYSSTGSRLRPFASAFAGRKLSAVTGPDILGFIQALKVSAATKRTYYRVIHASLNRAITSGYLAVNPLNKDYLKKLLKPAKPQIEILDSADEDKLQSAAAGTPLEAILMLARYTGMRIGEILHAQWQDVSWSRRMISITKKGDWLPKSHQERSIPLAGKLYEWLQKHRKEGKLPICPTSGGTMFAENPWKALQRLCKRTGVRDIGFHVFRHSFAVRLLERGATHYQVKELLGHSSVKVTEESYGNVKAEKLGGVIDLL